MDAFQFNINSAKPTNQTINVVFTKSSDVTSYVYQVYKDGNVIFEKESDLESTSIYLSETGNYQIVITANLKNGFSKTIQSGVYTVDKELPVIEISSDSIKINKGEKIDLAIKASDNVDGDITTLVTSNASDIASTGGELVYTVTDSAGNTAYKSVDVSIVHGNLLFLQVVIIAVLLFVIYLMFRFLNTLKFEKRITPFVIEPFENNDSTFFDKFFGIYDRIISKVGHVFEKSIFIKKYTDRLDKYAIVSSFHKNGLDIFSGKIVIGICFCLIAIVAKALQLKVIDSSELILVFTLGFFVLDVLFVAKYKVFRWKVESDFIAAITSMNNSFKSGRSIIQAIDNVSGELDGIIGREFNKMSLELLYGLSISDVFKRFAHRIDLEEASYLTASLSILNKTGGNITEVFSSIERSLFDKRKLRLELKSLTSGSKLVVFVLIGIPFFFVFVVSLINPDYFMPFINTSIGNILLLFMILYYIIFVIFVRKVMKVVI